MNRNGCQGQALVEFAVVTPVLLALACGAVVLSRSEWNRMRCTQVAFKAAHLARIGTPQLMLSENVQVETIPGGFRGRARCGSAEEVVELPTLEDGQW
jgi:hypothetical protein